MAAEGTIADHKSGTPAARAVAFDMDGVIVDSENGWVECVDRFLAGYGGKLTEQDRREALGCSYEHMVATICRIIGGEPAEVQRKLDEYLFEHHFSYVGLEIEGAPELLRDLHAAHARVALVTSSLAFEVERMLAETHLDGVFDVIVNADMVTHAKPDPEIYQLAIEKLGVPADQVVVVEDSGYGVEAARAAGVQVVQFNRFGVPRMDGTCAECADYGELRSVLGGLLGIAGL